MFVVLHLYRMGNAICKYLRMLCFNVMDHLGKGFQSRAPVESPSEPSRLYANALSQPLTCYKAYSCALSDLIYLCMGRCLLQAATSPSIS